MDAGTGSRPDAGTALRVTSWNMEWFGDPNNGPTDDALQYSNAVSILRTGGMDVYGLVEVVNPDSWNSLLKDLPDYQGVLASDTTAVSQPATCDSYGDPCYTTGEQKPALLYKSSMATFRSAQLILTDPSYSYEFAGRPPLRVDLTVYANGGSSDLVVIVLHLKAYSDATSWQRRQNAANDLKQYLDANLVDQQVLVVGDWNDDVDQSTAYSDGGVLPTPFQNFLEDASHYTFVTQALTNAGYRSTVRYPNMIDHHLVTRPLLDHYVPGSAQVLRPDLWGNASYSLNSYTTTSDHYPIESDYVLGGPSPATDGGTPADAGSGG